MVVGFTTTYAIGAYHHWCCEFESCSGRGVQHYVIKFVSDLRQVGGFLRILQFPPGTPISSTNKSDRHDITDILLKVALNTIKQTNNLGWFVSGLLQVGGFLRVLPISSTNKTDHHDITEILLKVALNTIKQTNNLGWFGTNWMIKLSRTF